MGKRMKKRRIKLFNAREFHQVNSDFPLRQNIVTISAHLRILILRAVYDAADTGSSDCVYAGRRLAVMRARLQAAVKCGATGLVACPQQCNHFRVRLPCFPMECLTHHLAIMHDDGSHCGIRSCIACVLQRKLIR